MRVSYNGYYATPPRWKCRFDSGHPLPKPKTSVRRFLVSLDTVPAKDLLRCIQVFACYYLLFCSCSLSLVAASDVDTVLLIRNSRTIARAISQ